MVSVIIACYNGAAYLLEAIDSVRRQTTAVAEIIVVDDGSTDDSRAVAGSCADVLLLSQDNAGAGAARNRGVSAARGEYLTFLDADDLMPPGAISARLEAMTNDVDAVGGLMENFADVCAAASADPAPLARARMLGAVLFRRSSFLQIGEFDPAVRMGEAMDWFDRFDAAGLRLRWVDALVLRRRAHANNSTRDRVRLQAEYLKVLRLAVHRRRRVGE